MSHDTLTAALIIPAIENTVLSDVLRVIRSAVVTRTEADEVSDVETLRKNAGKALRAFQTAYAATSLTPSGEKSLMEATGLRYEQVIQFGRTDLITLTDTLKLWTLKRGTAKLIKSESADLVQAKKVASAIGLDVYQTLRASGMTDGDQVTLTLGAIHDAVKVNRGGKIAHAVHNRQNATISTVTAHDGNGVSKANMALGRARRIARELALLKAKGKGETDLGKSDRAWISKNRPVFDAEVSRILNG